jgi:hypothetical protein
MSKSNYDEQSVPLEIRNRPDEFKIEQGLHAAKLPFLFQVRAATFLNGSGLISQ